MTAWFKRTRPETPPVVQDLTEAGEEAPAAFLARLAIECTPPCQDCYKPADFMVTIHLVDHCDRPAVEVFICAEHVSTIGNFVDTTIKSLPVRWLSRYRNYTGQLVGAASVSSALTATDVAFSGPVRPLNGSTQVRN
ncbi:hypothetical protein PROPHIGD91-2_38 [Mycobacterium phage prophiGD91-2]|nr:hypothetical protein PROPHIGD91-2_38 [Mycobacterium phage prophiGD91-2]